MFLCSPLKNQVNNKDSHFCKTGTTKNYERKYVKKSRSKIRTHISKKPSTTVWTASTTVSFGKNGSIGSDVHDAKAKIWLIMDTYKQVITSKNDCWTSCQTLLSSSSSILSKRTLFFFRPEINIAFKVFITSDPN